MQIMSGSRTGHKKPTREPDINCIISNFLTIMRGRAKSHNYANLIFVMRVMRIMRIMRIMSINAHNKHNYAFRQSRRGARRAGAPPWRRRSLCVRRQWSRCVTSTSPSLCRLRRISGAGPQRRLPGGAGTGLQQHRHNRRAGRQLSLCWHRLAGS